MANAQIAWDNAALDYLAFYNDGYGTYTNSLYNMRVQNLSTKWLSPSAAAADTRFTFTLTGLAGTPGIQLFALVNHNLTSSATVRVRASTVSNFASTVYDSTALAAYPAGTTAASRKGLMGVYVLPLGATITAQYWRVDIADASNPDGLVSVGRLCGFQQLWQPSVNMALGAALGFEPNYEVQKALNGAEWFTEANAHRVARFQIDQLGIDEMLNNGFDLLRNTAGSRREVIFRYDTSDTLHAVRRTIYGRLRNLSPIEQPQPTALGAAFEVKELI